jgi:hypothetical protein
MTSEKLGTTVSHPRDEAAHRAGGNDAVSAGIAVRINCGRTLAGSAAMSNGVYENLRIGID